jgi:RHS repeat-associated protein
MTKELPPPALSHKTTTEYDPGTGNLLSLVPPHLQGTGLSFTSTYDVFGRKSQESRPDGGWTAYQYMNIGNPTSQYVEKTEHIVGGTAPPDHYAKTYFDGLGRVYMNTSSGPDGKLIRTDTIYDFLGRVIRKYNPYFEGIDTPYYTTFTYDGLSRVIDVQTPDDFHIGTSYQGLTKVVTDKRMNPTYYTYDVYQRLKSVVDADGIATEYSYDVLGNLTQVVAAVGRPEQNVTTMTYDSLSKKIAMTDPDMGSWTYAYNKMGSLTFQRDAKLQPISFYYDQLNRLTEKVYPDHTVTYTYDDLSVPYSKGMQTKVSVSGSITNEDQVLEFDLMQRVKKGQKTYGTYGSDSFTVLKTYDSAGRVLSITYGEPTLKVISYAYDVAGNLLYVRDNDSGSNLAEFSGFTALGQQQTTDYPKAGNVSYKTTRTFDSITARLTSLMTQKMSNGSPTDTYQSLTYQYDPNGNPTNIIDQVTGPMFAGQDYEYDAIGNITSKSDVGTYSYTYGNKPHAVRQAGNISLDYDENGNMRQRVSPEKTLDITYNYDNQPELIKKNGLNFIGLTYDSNGQRVRKYNYQSGQTALYFGQLYELRDGIGIIHVFAGNQRIASIRSGQTQSYHGNHLGSASIIADQNGERKEFLDYYPFGTYERTDYDTNFPNANYTYTDQEEDQEIGLYNYKARLYDPLLGRFITPDSIVPDPGDPQALNRYSYVLNNPMVYVDPNGHDFGISAIIVGTIIGGLVAGIQSNWNPQAMLVGAVIGGVSGGVYSGVSGAVGGSLAAAVESGAISSTTAGIISGGIGGMAAGAAAGGLSSAYYGGNIAQGISMGAILGGLSGGAFGGIGGYYGDSWSLGRVGASTVAGGGISQLSGQGFEKGAMFAGATAFARFGYNEIVGYDAKWEGGEGYQEKGRYTLPREGFIHIGEQGKDPIGNFWHDLPLEGSPLSRGANYIPAVNATAGLHDVMQIKLDQFFGNMVSESFGAFTRSVLNYPGMIPAAALTTTGLLADPRAMMLFAIDPTRNR